MSKLMVDLCQLLQVKHPRACIYQSHAHCRNWDLLLPYMPFAIREGPEASIGFTPFKLLFGQHPGGLVDAARETWKEQLSLFHSLGKYIQDMQEQIDW